MMRTFLQPAPGRPKAAEHPLGGWHRYSGAGCAQFTQARRGVLAGLGVLALAPASWASPDSPTLDREQSQRVRDWMTLLIHAQVERGPTPRWTHRDCAGLVRFAVAEALRPHDLAWRRANGLLGTRVPPDVQEPGPAAICHAWRGADGSRHAFVGALELVQENTRFVSRQLAQAVPGDLLFYDFGDDQHLMVWMGGYVAYHTGHTDAADNGLRALRPAQLLSWQDTRWRPEAGNPNFSGLYRLAFLTP
jgi:uncharacterized protein YfaT (DUF1175 family)